MDYRKMYNDYYKPRPEPKASNSMDKKLATFFQKNKKTLKAISIIALSLIVLKYAILLFTPKPGVPAEVQARLDDLDNTTARYQLDQKRYDSLLADQRRISMELDQRLSAIKERVTIIREYYHIKSTAADKYTPTQIDSFLKSRYNY